MWKFRGDGSPIRSCLEFSPNGQWLAAIAAIGDDSGELRVWNVHPSPTSHRLAFPGVPAPSARWFRFHPESGNLVALLSSFLDTPEGEPVDERPQLVSWESDLRGTPHLGPRLPVSARDFLFDPFGSELIAEWAPGWGGDYQGMLRIRWPSGEPLSPWKFLYLRPRFTADGQYVVLLRDGWGVALDTRPVTGPTQAGAHLSLKANTVTMHPSEPWLLDVMDNRLRLQHIPSGELLRECELPDTQGVSRTAISSDGTRIAVAHVLDVVRIFDAESWHEVAAYDWGIGSISGLTFAPDGLRCAVGSNSGTIIIWDLE